ncbi:MAG: formate hydrogenlyase [Chloroflexi bacterium]|nr:MAG: formate hydrogenlyase [Chloroflexota bacterium]
MQIELFAFAQGVLLLLLAPAMVGVVQYFKARLQRRTRRLSFIGQPYRDLLKLLRKTAVRPQTASRFFGITPALLFVTYGGLAFTIPILQPETFIAADLIMIIYALGLARFVLSLAGLDAGAPLGGVGGSREMFLHFITEICLFLILAALALQWDTVNLEALITNQANNWKLTFVQPQFLLMGLAFFIIVLFENGRIPIDNPTTHLELTMSHRAITLEFAGFDLALIEWAEMIKFAFLTTLFLDLFVPLSLVRTWSFLPGAGWHFVATTIDYGLKLLFFLFILAFWEMQRPKLRLRQVIRPGLMAIVFCLIAIVYIVATVLSESA